MGIYDLKINRTDRTLGIDPDDVMFSFKAGRGNAFTLSLSDGSGRVISSSVLTLADAVCFRPGVRLREAGSYVVTVVSECGDQASLAFETAGKPGKAIAADGDCLSPVFFKRFSLSEIPEKARLTISGLGLYRAFVNGKRVGEEYLTPLMNDYGECVRFQTYSLDGLLARENIIEVYLGNGWFKGRFGIDGLGDRIYGDRFYLAAKITLGDGTEISTDESWQYREGAIRENGIYDGEHRDDTLVPGESRPAIPADRTFRFVPEYTAGVTAYETEKATLILSPKGEKILDFGHNAAGFVRFRNRLPRGGKIVLRYGEVLQDGCFYRDNLRTAKAEYVYTSDGTDKEVEPFFTYYGFRYVLVETDGEVNPEDFTAVRLSSKMDQTLEFRSSDAKLNRLIENAKRGQRSNFIDVPTDCPQRDERLGWTADTQVFAATASYNAETYSFYKKFMRDMAYDQNVYYDGEFPMYSPSLKGVCGPGGAVWSDAGVIVPWMLYRFYGDKELLRIHYEGIKKYLRKLCRGDEERRDGHLLSAPFTFGDWLAQDGICAQSMRGGTDDTFIRSVYYYNTACTAAEAAAVLADPEEKSFRELAKDIRKSILDEYFSKSGRLAVDTQTAYVLSLHFGIYVDKDKVKEGFRDRLRKDLYRMKSGFTGTPLMIRTLFENGLSEEAYRMIFNEKCPGWMYQINLGATTIWERWNSLLPDGKISGTAMNSLNHYAYGSVAEAIYRSVGGLQLLDAAWRKARIAPVPDFRVTSCFLRYDSPCGPYIIDWKVSEENRMTLRVSVPHGCKAEIVLPYSEKSPFEVEEGEQVWEYELKKDIRHPFSADAKVLDLLENEEARRAFAETLPQAYAMSAGENEEFLVMNVRAMGYLAMFGAAPEKIAELDEKLRKIGG
ncbi:MAG TPA: family 78 glycoside hydrolase catalytic domain [Candidatus Scatosoma pullistercoris]|uniref:alpha-L-rhamnosidase n=1 Tax=Candidatus Scatosoma pullistercoris TaxID=2840934 RepID=A0A9D1MFC6_9FIRM|nr:family 78 glycoside hydrolase catalytic domain [Candidatus Scatosoma pullistercoris]